MRALTCLIVMIFVAQFCFSQTEVNSDLQISIVSCEQFKIPYAPQEVDLDALPAVPNPPSISVYPSSSYKVGGWFYFTANSSGATEYQFNTSPTMSYLCSEYQVRSNVLELKFAIPYQGAQVVCKAKNAEGWGEYKILTINITK